MKFEVRASSFLENLDKKVFSPVEYVHQTSLHKALDLNEKLHQEQPDLIICADSIVVS